MSFLKKNGGQASKETNSGVDKINFILFNFHSASCYALSSHSRQASYLPCHTTMFLP